MTEVNFKVMQVTGVEVFLCAWRGVVEQTQKKQLKCISSIHILSLSHDITPKNGRKAHLNHIFLNYPEQ